MVGFCIVIFEQFPAVTRNLLRPARHSMIVASSQVERRYEVDC